MGTGWVTDKAERYLPVTSKNITLEEEIDKSICTKKPVPSDAAILYTKQIKLGFSSTPELECFS